MTEDRAGEAWFRQWFTVIDNRIVCVICGCVVDRSWRRIHCAFHGKKPDR